MVMHGVSTCYYGSASCVTALLCHCRIATKTVRFLTEQKAEYPKGLMLESPFNNIYDAAFEHPFARIFRTLWWFDDLFLDTMQTYGIYLQSDEQSVYITYYRYHQV